MVALVVWDLFQHVLYPCSWVNVGSLAGAYDRIYDYCTMPQCICSLFSSCKALGVDERAWLEDVLVREKKGKDGIISNIPEELKALLSSNWQPLAVNSK